MDTTTPLLLPSRYLPPRSSGSPAMLLASPPPRPPQTWSLMRGLKLLLLTSPAAFPFLMGYTYRNEWMRRLGVAPSEFALTTAEYMYRGLYAFVSAVVHAFELPQTRPDLVRTISWEISGAFVLFIVVYRTVQFIRKRFRESVRAFTVKLTRARRKALDDYTPETFVSLIALGTALLPLLLLMAVFWVLLVPVVAGRAGRADALSFWHSLDNPQVLNTYSTADVPDEHGVIIHTHVIEEGTSSYLLFDGQRFRVVRKELVVRQLGPAPPWKS